MDFKDVIFQLSERIAKIKDSVLTEEATKTALVMPFLNGLGYDIFNPMEVVPEFICDIGTKKGEKIDYAIMNNGEPAILIKCKHWDQKLDIHDNQLLRYYHVSKAKFAILTNGIIYRFYTDLEKNNIMDKKPFLEVDLTEIRDNQIEELRKFHKSYFDIDSIMNTASELKYTNELKILIDTEFNNPSVDITTYFAKKIYDGRLTPKVYEQLENCFSSAIKQWKNELIRNRFNAALENNKEKSTNTENTQCIEYDKNNLIVTTEEELQGYYIVKSILYNTVNSERIGYRDTQSYFGILLDDNNRKPICRLHFNGTKKYLETFDENKKGMRYLLSSLEDIFNYSEILKSTLKNYDTK